jgi:hypothetical protein
MLNLLHGISGLSTEEVMANAVLCAVNGPPQFRTSVISLKHLPIDKAVCGRPGD